MLLVKCCNASRAYRSLSDSAITKGEEEKLRTTTLPSSASSLLNSDMQDRDVGDCMVDAMWSAFFRNNFSSIRQSDDKIETAT